MNFRSLFALCLLASLAPTAHARVISWGSAVGDAFYDSLGNDLDNAFRFEVGTFGAFVPTLANLDQWEANWSSFDAAFAPAGNGWNSGASFLTSSANLQTNGTSSSLKTTDPLATFAEGAQGYLWAFNTQTLGTGAEWALITSAAWLFPQWSDQINPSLNWRFSTATTPVLGALNNIQGPGSYDFEPVPGGISGIQTALVPEPGSALLLTISLAPLARRRRSPKA
jgi:hypothetical protein